MHIAQCLQHSAYSTMLMCLTNSVFSFQDNLRCFRVNYDMSQITRFSVLFLSLKLASVLSYYAFPSLDSHCEGSFPPLWLHPESGKYMACWGGRWSKRMGIVQQMVPRSRLDAELHWSGAKSKAGAPVLGGKAHVHATSKIQLIYFQSWIGYL